MKAKKIAATSIAWMDVSIWKVPNLITSNHCAGEWDESAQRINIDASLKGPLLNDTIIHELIHAIVSVYGFRLSHNVITTLGVMLAQGLTKLKKLRARSRIRRRL